MLARTADNLFWLARYVERAEFAARIIDVTARLAALPKAYGGGAEWESALSAVGSLDRFRETYETADEASVLEFLIFDPQNPSSIRACVESARTNARAVRTALTADMWQCVNAAWLELRSMERARAPFERMSRERIVPLLDVVKGMSRDFDGAAYRNMLRNDAYWFSRLGLYMERADNTARILDVKYHVILPESEAVGGSLDYFQWTAILRAVSAFTAYHWVYRQGVKPWLIADLLILKKEMPRSLVSCYDNLVRYLDAIATAYGAQGPAQRHARSMLLRLENGALEDVFQTGLHEFLSEFISDNARLGTIIAEQYLVN
jgi:uncharacterized alpha-E superfamily protein